MKRTLSMALILGLVATASMAVESVNTVGYQDITSTAAGRIIVGAQFSVVGDQTTGLDIQDAVSGSFANNDRLLFFNGTYEIYLWNDVTYTDGTYSTLAGPGWHDGSQIIASREITAGEAFWVETSAATPFTPAGQVRKDQVSLTTTAGQLHLISNPYPTAVALNDIVMTGVVDNDRILLYTGGSYQIFLWNDVTYTDGTYSTLAGPGWHDGSQVKTDFEIPMGAGFWTDISGSAQIDFPTVL